jgi:hypothetical protein
MTPTEFVEIITKRVYESTVSGCLSLIERPPVQTRCHPISDAMKSRGYMTDRWQSHYACNTDVDKGSDEK